MKKSDINKLISDFLEECRAGSAMPLLVILGPTASGKTALSIDIAKEFNGEIISADSRQVYRGMDIGTDKISEKDRGGIPHFLLDVVDPPDRFTVADFKKLAEKRIGEILARGALPMLVGGTGLYLRAITQNFLIPPENPALRKELLKEADRAGGGELHKRLAKLDPVNAAKIHPNNIPYVVRALEIVMTTGKPKGADQKPSPYRCLQIGLRMPNEILFDRINKRIDEQLMRGLEKETRGLLDKGYSKKLPAMSSLGYREIVEYMEGRLSLDKAKELLKQNTRNFAKRQITWFKRDKDAVWIEI